MTKVSEITDKLKQRLESSIQNQFDLNQNKIDVHDQIDKFFDEVLSKVEERR